LFDQIKISLWADIQHQSPSVSISINGADVFSGTVDRPMVLDHKAKKSSRLNVIIKKSGKTKEMADRNQPQEIVVEDVSMNGLSLHPDKFGKFHQSGNPYARDKTLEGSIMALNGSWELDIPIFRQEFVPNLDKPYRDQFVDTEVACFGCSFTYGFQLQDHQTWPHLLGGKNYGWADDGPTGAIKQIVEGGSCISSIVGTANEYLKKNHCEKMVLLMPHPCRLQVVDEGKVKMLLPQHSSTTTELAPGFREMSKDIVLFGEASLILSGYANTLKDLLRDMSRKTKIFISAYQQETYECFQALEDESFRILPFYEMSEEFEMAPDNLHPGPDHNRIFANKIKEIVLG
jgi:hypothetical protein